MQETLSVLDYLTRAGVREEQLRELATPYTKNIVELILRSPELSYSRQEPWEFKTIAQLGAEDFVCQRPYWFETRNPSKDCLIDALDSYSECVNRYLPYIDQGLPMYINEMNDHFRRADDSDETWLFARLLVKNGGYTAITFSTPPTWATTLWINRLDLRANEILFCDAYDSGIDGTKNVAIRRLRRNAFRAYRSGLLLDSSEQSFDPSVLNERAQHVESINCELPTKLEAAIAAYKAIRGNEELRRGRSPKAALMDWLETNRPSLSNQAREEIAKVANWQPEGGAPQTPARPK